LPFFFDVVAYGSVESEELKQHIDGKGKVLFEREMSEWREVRLESVLEVKYGKDHKKLQDGLVPCYGTGGIMRYVNNELYDEESILIPRKGSLNNIYYLDEPFWTVDTLFWTKIDKDKVVTKFLFYQLTLIDFTILNVGSAVPSLTVPVLNEIDISLPPLPEQKAIILPILFHKPLAKKRFCHLFKGFVLAVEQVDFVIQRGQHLGYGFLFGEGWEGKIQIMEQMMVNIHFSLVHKKVY
jgi:hypothetical protein